MGGVHMAAPSKVGSQNRLSFLSDSLGPLKDDMLLVETRGPQDNRSLCALEPSGCTPLLSRASTVSAGGPSSVYLSSSISNLALDVPLFNFPLLCARLCASLLERGGDLDLSPVLSGLSEVSQSPIPHPAQLQPGGFLGAMPLGDSPLPLGLAEGISPWRALTTRPGVRPVFTGE